MEQNATKEDAQDDHWSRQIKLMMDSQALLFKNDFDGAEAGFKSGMDLVPPSGKEVIDLRGKWMKYDVCMEVVAHMRVVWCYCRCICDAVCITCDEQRHCEFIGRPAVSMPGKAADRITAYQA